MVDEQSSSSHDRLSSVLVTRKYKHGGHCEPAFIPVMEAYVSEISRSKYLSAALVVVGLIFLLGIYPLMIVWPSGWAWHSGHSHYPAMIVGIYATLGAFLLAASRNPFEHLSLIWFTVWSSVVHAAIMGFQALANPDQVGHLWGDVLALFAVAGVLMALTPKGVSVSSSAAGASGD